MKRVIRGSVTSSKIVDDPNAVNMIITVGRGVNADGFEIYIVNAAGDQLFKSSYTYGYNVSYDKKFADWAQSDYDKAMKNGWSNKPALKPYVSDIIDALCEEYNVTDIQVVPGKNIYKGNNVEGDAVEDFKSKYLSNIVLSAKDATFKTDKRLSPTSERYKGYLIVLDRGGDGYNVYDKHRELEDAGYPSLEAAKQFIDELESPENIISSVNDDDLIINKTYITLSDCFYDTLSNLHDADWDDVIDGFEANNWISGDELIIPKGTKMTLSEVNNYYNVFEVCTSRGKSYIPLRIEDCDGLFREVTDREIYSSSHKSKSPYEVKHGITYTRSYSNDSGDQISIFVYDDDPDKQEYGEGGPSGDYFRGRWTQNMQDYYTRRGFKLDNTLKQNVSSAIDNIEREFQRIDRSVTSSETFDAHSYAKQRKQSSEFNKWLKRVESAILRNDTTRIKNIKESLMYMTPSQLSNKLTSYLIDKLNSALTTSSDDIKSASYGGAFDIEDDQFFTKDEIVEFGNTVCDHLNETFYDTYDVSNVYMETPKKLVLTVVQKSDESEFTATIDIDMRKIKKPADLMNRYLGDVVYALQQDIKAYNDEINASSDITSAQKTGVDEIKTKVWNAASAKMEDMGFPVDEIPDYLFVEVKQADDHIRVEVRAELTYNGLTKLTNELDPIVQSFDKDSYFEPVEPGIAEAYIWNLSKINSSETVEAGSYDVPDRPLDPPEDNSWEELDSDDEVIELTLDAIVHIDEDGSWEYDDTNYPWAASPDNKRGDWYTDEYSVYIGDKTSIVEYVDELLEPMMPAKAGEYHIKGDVTLVFSVEGIEVKRDYFWDERHGADYDEEAYTDDAETSFLYDKSHIKNFEITER